MKLFFFFACLLADCCRWGWNIRMCVCRCISPYNSVVRIYIGVARCVCMALPYHYSYTTLRFANHTADNRTAYSFLCCGVADVAITSVAFDNAAGYAAVYIVYALHERKWNIADDAVCNIDRVCVCVHCAHCASETGNNGIVGRMWKEWLYAERASADEKGLCAGVCAPMNMLFAIRQWKNIIETLWRSQRGEGIVMDFGFGVARQAHLSLSIVCIVLHVTHTA